MAGTAGSNDDKKRRHRHRVVAILDGDDSDDSSADFESYSEDEEDDDVFVQGGDGDEDHDDALDELDEEDKMALSSASAAPPASAAAEGGIYTQPPSPITAVAPCRSSRPGSSPPLRSHQPRSLSASSERDSILATIGGAEAEAEAAAAKKPFLCKHRLDGAAAESAACAGGGRASRINTSSETSVSYTAKIAVNSRTASAKDGGNTWPTTTTNSQQSSSQPPSSQSSAEGITASIAGASSGGGGGKRKSKLKMQKSNKAAAAAANAAAATMKEGAPKPTTVASPSTTEKGGNEMGTLDLDLASGMQGGDNGSSPKPPPSKGAQVQAQAQAQAKPAGAGTARSTAAAAAQPQPPHQPVKRKRKKKRVAGRQQPPSPSDVKNGTTSHSTETPVKFIKDTTNTKKRQQQKAAASGSAAAGKKRPAAASTAASDVAASNKKTKKKRRTFQDEVYHTMLLSCKPYTLKTLAQTIRTTEQALSSVMLSLLDKDLVRKKDFPSGKSGRVKTLYWANQEATAREAKDVQVTPDEVKEAKEEAGGFVRRERALAAELEALLHEPTNEDLCGMVSSATRDVDEVRRKVGEAKERIRAASAAASGGAPARGAGGVPKSAKQLERERCPRRMKMRINSMRGEWKSRKDKCMDFVDNLADAMEKKVKDVVKILDVETDEALGVKLPLKYAID